MLLEVSILDLPEAVQNALELNGFFIVIMRWVGYAIYSFVSGILDLCETAFTAILKFDILKIDVFVGYADKIKPLLISVMFLAFLIVLVINFLGAKSQLKVAYNIAMIILAITAFAEFTDFVVELRDTGIKEVDRILQKAENESLSDRLFRLNTYDMKKSAENGKLEFIDESIPIGNYFVNAELASDVVPDKLTVVDGELSSEYLNSGFLDYFIGNEAYLAYTVDYVALNLNGLIMTIVYLLGIIKAGALVWEFALVCLQGQIIIATSVDTNKRVSMIFTTLFKNGLGFIFVYFLMAFYSVLLDAMFKNQLTDNWLANCLLLLVGSAFVLLGGDKMMQSLGISGGDSGLMRTGALIYGTSRLGRMGGKIKNKWNKSVGKNLDDHFNQSGEYPQFAPLEKETVNGADNLVEKPRDTSNYINGTSFDKVGSTNYDQIGYTDRLNPENPNIHDVPPIIRMSGSSGTTSFNNDRLNQLSTFSDFNEKGNTNRNVYSEYGMKEESRVRADRAETIQKKLAEPNRKLKFGSTWYTANGNEYFMESKSGKKMMPDWYMQREISNELENRIKVNGERKTIYDDELNARLNQLKGDDEFIDVNGLQAELNELRGELYGSDTEENEDKEQRVWNF